MTLKLPTVFVFSDIDKSKVSKYRQGVIQIQIVQADMKGVLHGVLLVWNSNVLTFLTLVLQ